jgi:hypothetical protein
MSDAAGKKTTDARVRMDDGQTFTIAILGDLHLDPRYMDDHIAGREHFLPILTGKDGLPKKRSCVVSLGDLGESKPVKPDSKELFAGTSDCFKLARNFLDGFKVPFEVVGGNHDLEGIDEFATDEVNLAAYLKAFDKPAAQFRRDLADKVALIGLGSTAFRTAQYTSHEVCCVSLLFVGASRATVFTHLSPPHLIPSYRSTLTRSRSSGLRSRSSPARPTRAGRSSSLATLPQWALVCACFRRTTWSTGAAG